MTQETNETRAQPAILRELGEFNTIARLAARLNIRSGVRVGIGDDCAVLGALSSPVVSTDALVEGVHFRRDWTTPFDLGRKTLAVSVSDLAACGARPVAAFLSLCAPPDLELPWLDSFFEGLESLAREFDFSVAGGDTTRAPLLVLSATLVGDLLPEAHGQPVLRSGARVGDIVCVSGDLGASAAGLEVLSSQRTRTQTHEIALKRHFDPLPRLELMRALLGSNRAAIHAGMDISDGLSGDAQHLAARSNVRLRLDASLLPIADTTRALARELNVSALDWALGGGEDYELLLCVEREAFSELSHFGLTRVGEVVEGEAGVEIVGGAPGKSWTHF